MTDSLLSNLRSMGRTHDDATVAHEAADEIERLRGVIADLIGPMRRVIAISDRKHDAWDAAKAAIAKATG